MNKWVKRAMRKIRAKEEWSGKKHPYIRDIIKSVDDSVVCTKDCSQAVRGYHEKAPLASHERAKLYEMRKRKRNYEDTRQFKDTDMHDFDEITLAYYLYKNRKNLKPRVFPNNRYVRLMKALAHTRKIDAALKKTSFYEPLAGWSVPISVLKEWEILPGENQHIDPLRMKILRDEYNLFFSDGPKTNLRYGLSPWGLQFLHYLLSDNSELEECPKMYV